MSNVVVFIFMSAIWGLTWIATKVVAAAVMPALSAGTRFLAVGILLLAWRWFRGHPTAVASGDRWLLVTNGLLLVTACYGLLF